jgi:hypothetical protein
MREAQSHGPFKIKNFSTERTVALRCWLGDLSAGGGHVRAEVLARVVAGD